MSSGIIIIAVDGYSSCGKSTLAKQLAKHLDIMYIDTGAMYRAVTLYFLQHSTILNDGKEVEATLGNIHIEFKYMDDVNTTFLNGADVESEIRSLAVSQFVSEVAAIPAVRKKMVALQRDLAGKQSVVMDGRDIGTVVFPDADVKFFLTADLNVRAQRRYDELKAKNGEHISLEEILANLRHRDEKDTSRSDSPLRKADDAILIDNTHLGKTQQFDLALSYIVTSCGIS